MIGPVDRRGRGALHPRDDSGYSLTEVIVTLAVLSLLMSFTTVIFVRVLSESSAQRLTLAGLQQAELMESTFTQYLRSAYPLDAIATNGDDIIFTTEVGMCPSSTSTTLCPSNLQTGAETPASENVEAGLCTTSNPKVDTVQMIFGETTPTSGAWQPQACSSNLPAGERRVQVFDISPPAGPIFTYWQWGNLDAAGNPIMTQLSATTASAGLTNALPADQTQAVGINVEFIPAPGPQTEGYSSELGTNLSTVAFLRNLNPSNQ